MLLFMSYCFVLEASLFATETFFFFFMRYLKQIVIIDLKVSTADVVQCGGPIKSPHTSI